MDKNFICHFKYLQKENIIFTRRYFCLKFVEKLDLQKFESCSNQITIKENGKSGNLIVGNYGDTCGFLFI